MACRRGARGLPRRAMSLETRDDRDIAVVFCVTLVYENFHKHYEKREFLFSTFRGSDLRLCPGEFVLVESTARSQPWIRILTNTSIITMMRGVSSLGGVLTHSAHFHSSTSHLIFTMDLKRETAIANKYSIQNNVNVRML